MNSDYEWYGHLKRRTRLESLYLVCTFLPLFMSLFLLTLEEYLKNGYLSFIALLLILPPTLTLLFCSEEVLLTYHTRVFHEFRSDQALFRVHFRTYSTYYLKGKEQPKLREFKPDCLTCPQQATIVYFPCGHLVFCRSCWAKYWKKKYRQCAGCYSIFGKVQELDEKPRKKRWGYSRKWFIEKKLLPNQ